MNNQLIYHNYSDFNLALQSEDYDNCEKILNIMDTQSPNHLLVLDCLIRYQMQTMYHDKAMETAERAIEFYPNYPYFYYYMACIATQQEKLLKACDYAVKAMEMDSENLNFLYTTADILTQLQRFEPAIDLYRNIIMIGQNQYKAVIKLSRCYFLTNKKYEARQNLQQLWEIIIANPTQNRQILSDIVQMCYAFDADTILQTFNPLMLDEYRQTYHEVMQKKYQFITLYANLPSEQNIMQQLPNDVFAFTSQYYGDTENYFYLPEMRDNFTALLHHAMLSQSLITDDLDVAIILAYHQKPVFFIGQIPDTESLGGLMRFITDIPAQLLSHYHFDIMKNRDE